MYFRIYRFNGNKEHSFYNSASSECWQIHEGGETRKEYSVSCCNDSIMLLCKKQLSRRNFSGTAPIIQLLLYEKKQAVNMC